MRFRIIGLEVGGEEFVIIKCCLLFLDDFEVDI
jgi:hypothetical protein